jgi:hypothetical protein
VWFVEEDEQVCWVGECPLSEWRRTRGTFFRGLWHSGVEAVCGVEVGSCGWWTRRSEAQGPSNPWLHKREGVELRPREWRRHVVEWMPTRDWRLKRRIAWHGRDVSVSSRACRLW